MASHSETMAAGQIPLIVDLERARAGEVTLEVLLDRQIPLHWQEAVAIVQELSRALVRSRAEGVPETANIRLTSSGRVELLPGPSLYGDPITGLAQTLRKLLPPDHPVGLNLLASAAALGSSAYDSISAFSDALRQFERAGQGDLIYDVYRRYQETLVTTDLRPRIKPQVPPSRRGKIWPARAVVPVLIGLTVVTAFAVVWWLLTLPPASSTLGVRVSAVSAVSQAVETAVTAVSSVPQRVTETLVGGKSRASSRVPPAPVPTSTADAESPTASPTSRARDRERAPRDRELPVTVPRSTPAVGVSDLRTVVPLFPTVDSPELGGVPLPGPRPVDRAAGSSIPSEAAGARFDATLYDSAVPGIVPPAIVRPRLPSAPPGRSQPRGIVEAIISETGEVESVRLITIPNNVHESMIVSAVKTWRFRPATRDGRPVRFRQPIPITFR